MKRIHCMKRLNYLFLILGYIFLSDFSVLAQTKYVIGKVLDSAILKPIPYVNIGISAKNFGTTSDENGMFELTIPKEFLQDTLTFSFVGFETIQKSISDLSKNVKNEIHLSERNNALDEVVLISKKPKIRKIGITSHNPLLWGSIQNKDSKDIVEFGKRINLRKPSQILAAKLFLNGVDDIDSARVRVNFYDFSEELPGKRIVFKEVFKNLNLQKGWLTIEMENLDIVIDQNFFMSFEILPNANKSDYFIYYGGKLGGGSSFSRMNSQGSWSKLQGANVSTHVIVKQ